MSSGASSAADAATLGQAQPLAVRLIGRGSLAGALVVLLIALAYAVVLPRVAIAVSAPSAPQRVDIGGGATVAVSEDWSQASSAAGTLTLTQGGAQLVITAPRASTTPPAVRIDALARSWLASSADPNSVATTPKGFTTDAGDDAATVVVQEATQTGEAWVVSDGTQEVVAALTSPTASWDAASASAQALIRTLVLPRAVG
ncbi:hypothetical protein [Demequina soli]|uniref:hypothetical protein n=1 Tax=Demequina soli TaxID=1638987 RepID=UPI00078076D7|nr:hypothetical protein [Demequina soli]